MDNRTAVIAIAVMALITFGLRAAPFLLFTGEKTPGKRLLYLGRTLPPAVMGMLVVYCYKGTSFAELTGWLPGLLAGLFTALLQIRKRNALLSITAGVIAYMVLIRLI